MNTFTTDPAHNLSPTRSRWSLLAGRSVTRSRVKIYVLIAFIALITAVPIT